MIFSNRNVFRRWTGWQAGISCLCLWLSLGDRLPAQTFTNDVRVYSYSFILPMLSGSGLNVYFSTPDNNGLQLPLGANTWDITGEVAPQVVGGGTYRTDFLVYSPANQQFVAYGDASVANIPVSTDLDQNGFADVLQWDQVGTFTTTGQIQYTDGSSPQTRSTTLRFSRGKGAATGTCSMSFVESGATINLSGSFIVPGFYGKSVVNKASGTFTSTVTANISPILKSVVAAEVGFPGGNTISLTGLNSVERSNNTILGRSYFDNLILTQRITTNFRGYVGLLHQNRDDPVSPFPSLVDSYVVVDCPDTDEDGSLDLTDDTPLGVPSTFTGTGQVVGEAGKAVAPVTVGVSPTCRNFVATGLPSGLAINLTSGVISGTPTTAGIYPFSVTARVKAGLAPATTNFLAWVSGAAQTLPFTDDFSRVVPNRYLFSSTNVLPRMIVTNGLLEYRSTNPPQNTAWATPSLLLTLTNSWDLQVDARVPTNWPVGGGEAKVGVSLLKEVPGGTFADILPNRINLKFGVGPEGNSFQYHYHVNDTETLGANLIATNGGVARLRFLFHGGTRTLTLYGASYTGTNLSPWTKLGEESLAPGQGLGEGWGLALTNRLRLALWGETDAEDGNANGARRMALDNLSVTLVTPPRITGVTNFNGQVGASFSNRLTATNGQTYFTATNLPAGLTLDETNGIISGVPETAGRFTNARVGVGNPAAASDTPVSFTLLPAFISSNAVTGFVNDGGFSHRVEVSTNNFSSNLRFGATGLPTGININASNGLISGKPTVAGAFPATVTITALGASATQRVDFTIHGAAGGVFSLTVNPRPTNVLNLPAGLTYNRASGVISGTPQIWGVFTSSALFSNGTTTNVEIPVMPSVPVIVGPTNWNAQVGQATRFQIVAGGAGREWAGWDGFDGATPSTNWLSSGPLAAFRTNAASKSGVGTHQGRLALTHGGTTNQTGSGYLVWARTIPVGARWVASAEAGISTNLSLVRRTNNLGQATNGQWIATKINLLRAGSELTESRQLTAEFVRSPEEGNLVLARTNALAEIGKVAVPVEESGLALRFDSPETFSSQALPDGEPAWQTLHFLSSADLGLQLTNQVRLALGGFSEFFLLSPGQVWMDNFVLLPDPDSLSYRAFLVGSNGASLTNEAGDPYLPEGLALESSTGTILGAVSTNVLGGIYRIRVEAEYNPALMPLPGLPAVRGGTNVTLTLLPAFIGASSVEGRVNDPAFRHQILLGTNNFGSNLRFSASNLPTGTAINATSGVISGRPTVAGTFPATVTITAFGASASQRVDFSLPAAVGGQFNLILNPRPTNITGLPAGLIYNRTTGMISGIPQLAGQFEVVGQLSGGATTNLPISVLPSAPVIVSPTNAVAKVGEEFFYQIIPGGPGREWAGFDSFATTTSTNWAASTNQRNASLIRPGGLAGGLVFRPGGTNTSTQRAAQFWKSTVPAHVSWMALVDTAIKATNLPGTFEFGMAAVQIEGKVVAPLATPPQFRSMVWNRIQQSGFATYQVAESLLDGLPWTDLFAGRTDVAGFNGNELGFANGYTIYGGGLSMISNQVVYRSTAPGSFGILPPLRLSVERSWTATARVKMGDDWSIPHADISLGVMKAPQSVTPRIANLNLSQMTAAASNRFVVKIGRNMRDGNYFGYHGYAAGGYDDDGPNQITTSKMGWLRLSYDAAARTLSSSYDPDNPDGETPLKVESLDWDDPNSLGALWGLDSNASFWIFLSGGTEGSGNGNSPSRMAIDWFSVNSSDDPRFSQEGIGQGICAFGYDADAKEISSFRWDPEDETLVEMGKVSVADWQISNNSSFGLFLSGMALSTGLTATTPCAVFDNFVLMPWKEEFTYEVVNGALPSGVSLGASGSISGNPTAPGNFQATIRVTGAGGTTTHSLSLVVQP